MTALLLDEVSLTVAAAAQRLGVSQQTIWRWIEQGRLPAYRVGQKRVRIKSADLEQVITPIVHGERGGRVARTERAALGPLTAAERKQGMEALEQARQLQAEMLAQRKGKLFGRSEEALAELRDERTRSLS